MLTSTLTVLAVLQPLFGAAPDQPDTITVIGRAPLSETPASVALIDSETLRNQALVTLGDALLLVPGIQVVETGPLGTQTSLFIRGTDSDHTLATLDGIRLNNPATPNGAYSFGSDLITENLAVEVLRGPGSATYGSDAIGGVVNLRPRVTDGGSLDGSVGELGTYRGSVHAGGRVGDLTYSVGGAAARTKGWDALPGRIVPEERVGERDGADGFLLNADLDYAVTEAFTLTLTGLHRDASAEFDTFSGGPGGFLRADADLSSEDTLSVLRAGVTYGADAWSATTNIGIVDGEFREENDGLVTGNVRGERRFAELLARANLDFVMLSAGLIFEREDVDIPVSFNDPLRAREDHGGGFVFAQGRVSEALTVSGAVRIDGYDTFGTPVTFNAGAAYIAGPLRLRANLGTAFNAPSLSERFSVSPSNRGNRDLGEERAIAGEVAAAYVTGVAGGQITAEAVLFRTDTDDLIEYDFVRSQNVNVGDARAQGAELSVAYARAGLDVFAAYTYTDAENRDTGAALLRRPEHGFVTRVSWHATDRLSLSGRWSSVGERPDVTYTDEGLFGGAAAVEGFDTIAATAHYAITDALTGYVTATNLSGETFEQPAGFGSPPRQARVGVRYGW